MTDDELIQALGRAAREQSRDEERWDRLAKEPRGARDHPPADEREDDEAALARRLLREPSEEELRRTADRVMEALAKKRNAPVAKVVPLRQRSIRVLGVVALPLAAAAALVLFLRPRGESLPEYALSASGGVSATRGVDETPRSEAIVAASGVDVVLLARPRAPAEGNIYATAFVRCAGHVVVVPSASEAASSGALRVTVPGGAIVGAVTPRASCELGLLLGRSAAPDARALESAGARGDRGDWVRLTVPVRVREAVP